MRSYVGLSQKYGRHVIANLKDLKNMDKDDLLGVLGLATRPSSPGRVIWALVSSSPIGREIPLENLPGASGCY